MIHKLNIPAIVTTQQCFDVIQQASDYIGYWECGFRNHKYDDLRNMVSFEVHCVDSAPTEGIPCSEEEGSLWALIDQNTIVRGVELIVGGHLQINSQTRASLIELLGDKEMGISFGDVDMADAIVQAGVFGELVYG